jgi:hypothetical protein
MLAPSARAQERLQQNGPDPAPVITTEGGWDGGYVRLTQEVNSQNNSVAFPQTVSGPYQSLSIDFDFRFSPGVGGGADGVAFAYLSSADFGAGIDVATPVFSEEANLANSFGVGFDTFNNADQGDGGESSVSLHWNNARIGSVAIDGTALGTFENNVVHRASIDIVPTGTGSNVTISVTNGTDTVTPFDNVFVDGLVPYDGRMAFNARTGGANSDQGIDNITLRHWAGGNSPTTTVEYHFIPEPSSVMLLLLGLVGAISARRRRA